MISSNGGAFHPLTGRQQNLHAQLLAQRRQLADELASLGSKRACLINDGRNLGGDRITHRSVLP
jgi:hypothetical protein